MKCFKFSTFDCILYAYKVDNNKVIEYIPGRQGIMTELTLQDAQELFEYNISWIVISKNEYESLCMEHLWCISLMGDSCYI